LANDLWHAIETAEVMRILGTDSQGLTMDEAKKRLEKYGPNELQEAKRVSPLKIFFEQFKEILIIILLVATVISALIGEIVDAIVIVAIVIACAALGFIQEYRAEKSLELLKRMAAPTATVIREGREMMIPAREVVPGDIIQVKTGDKVPADARVLESFNLKVNEAPLTGESVPVGKKAVTLPSDTPLTERLNILASGTVVTYGRGTGVVVRTGMSTEFGKIAGMLQTVKEETTPLESRMQSVGSWLIKALFAIVGVIVIIGLFRGHELIEMFLWGVSLAVAAVPEALPAIVTGALAIGVYRMAKKNAIVRRLPAVETLGSSTVICSDKTGTLTKGEMTVRRIYLNEQSIEVTGVGYEPVGEFHLSPSSSMEEIQFITRIATLCSDARLEKGTNWQIIGDPTEGALVVSAAKAGWSQMELNKQYPRVGEVPFTSERKMMSTIHSTPIGGIEVCVKGAPEIILEKSTHIWKGGNVIRLDKDEAVKILKANEAMASEGLRVLGIAYRMLDKPFEEYTEENVEKNLIFVGLLGMIDPARKEAVKAVELCKQAGVKVVMVTGDHKLTAQAIAKELGLIKSSGLVLTGAELDKMSDEEFDKIVEDVVVYARVSPEHKMRIVKALKKKEHIVAMTGDGINDAPALKNSDIGVAMGITGTDVTKEASDMVLADDNFATIVEAIREGRAIFDNIKKYLTYLLSCNIGELLIMAFAGIVNLPLPLLAKQILYVNLATDGLPAIALGIDPPDQFVMNRPARDPKESVFKGMRIWLAGISLLLTVGCLLVFYFGLMNVGWTEEGIVKARSMIFATIILFEILFALSCRSFQHPVYKIGFFANKYLLMAVAGEIILLALFPGSSLFSVPFLNSLFEVIPLQFSEWVIVILVAFTGFVASEVAKICYTRVTHRAYGAGVKVRNATAKDSIDEPCITAGYL